MRIRTLSVSRTASRTTIALVAFAAIALALLYVVRPVQATGTQVDINQKLPIDSATFQEDCEDSTSQSGVDWVFILNQYTGGAQLFGTFSSAGSFGPIDPSKINASNQHFLVNTPGDDTLTSAFVILDSAAGDAQLVLSHVCHQGEQSQSEGQSQSQAESESQAESVSQAESQSQSQAESESQEASQSGEGSQLGGTGTPAGSVSNGAVGQNGVNPLPTVLFSLILLASLAGLAFANVKTARSRS